MLQKCVSQLYEPVSGNLGRENSCISSPNSNFSFEQLEKLENLHSKLSVCGSQEYVMIGCSEGKTVFKSVPVYCNNRSCDNSGCKSHRLYLYKRNHQPQIDFLKDDIAKPKAYVFTGWNIPLSEWGVDKVRWFCREKVKFLYSLMRRISRTEFSIHMELKLYPQFCDNSSSICRKCHTRCKSFEPCPKYGIGYLHFHVVSGFVDVNKARSIWKRVVKYEQAISFDYLEGYIAKYASKVPYFASSYDQDLYHLVVYKTQMHRYSVPLSECEKVHRLQEWYLESLIIEEAYHVLDRYTRRNGGYSRWVEERRRERVNSEDKPPPKAWADLRQDCEVHKQPVNGLYSGKKYSMYPLDEDGNYFEVESYD